MFSDELNRGIEHNFTNPKLAPNPSSDVKVIEITLYVIVNGTGPLRWIKAWVKHVFSKIHTVFPYCSSHII